LAPCPPSQVSRNPLWERGEHLAAICLQWLEGARARLAAALPAQDEPGDSAAPF
jgi:exodeoxyribonuclease VII small subunit